jgi:hypothetical protein
MKEVEPGPYFNCRPKLPGFYSFVQLFRQFSAGWFDCLKWLSSLDLIHLG